MGLLILLIAVGALAYRGSTPEQRIQLVRWLRDRSLDTRDDVQDAYASLQPFRGLLRARTRWAIVTAAVAALNVTIYLAMVFGEGAVGDPTTMVRWGASLGTRTTNGEWWRLLTSLFVHGGFYQVLVTTAAFVQVGIILERLVGPAAFASVYFVAGLVASMLRLSDDPLAVHAGSSSAVLAVYGLLAIVWAWARYKQSLLTIPLLAFKFLAPSSLLFLLHTMSTTGLFGGPNFVGLTIGVCCGCVMTWGVVDATTPIRRPAIVAAVTLVLVAVAAVPLRGITDARPLIELVVSTEERTSAAYDAAVARFTRGRTTDKALAELIEGTIRPELQAVGTQLEALGKVPREHEPLVTAAKDYLRLRDDSWRLRAEALKKSSIPGLREADTAERSSLDAFRALKPADPSS
jgi:membrane associated rhomboid family serine protease